MHIGRVVGNSVMETRFRINYGESLQVGEMLVVESDDSAERFLVRVVDIEHGADSIEKDWMISRAGEILRQDAQSDDFDVDKVRPQLYCSVLSIPLGYIGNDFKKTKTIPPHFARVRRTNAQDYEFLKGSLGDLEVGNLRSGDKVLDFPVGIAGQAIPHHIGIFATTGMGKSNLMKSLALSGLLSRRYGMLILDPHGEYYDGGEGKKKGLVHSALAGDGLVVYSSRKLDGPYNAIHVSSTEIEISDLANLYEFTGAQLECLQAAQYRYGNSWLVDLLKKDVKTVVADMQDRFHEGTVNVIKRRLESIFQFDLVSSDPQLSITRNILSALHSGKVVLVDTSNMFEAEELLISTVLTRAIFENHKESYSDKAKFSALPPVLIALEEAQRVLGQAKGTVFAQIAREGRKFKVGLCAISQQPKLMNEEIISQFNTLFILGLADKRDRDILRSSAKQDLSMLDNEIQMLMPGEVLIASPFTPFAVPAKIHLYEEYLGKTDKAQPQRSKAISKTTDSHFF